MWRILSIPIFMAAPLAFGPLAYAEAKYTLQDLGTLGGTFSTAVGINALGDVVGGAGPTGTAGANGLHAFLYRAGVMADLNTPIGSQSTARAINGTGQIVVNTFGNDLRAYLLTTGNFAEITGPGVLGVEAFAINDSAQVVGSASTSTTTKAYIYSGGPISFLDLSSLGDQTSVAYGINNNNQIVGQFFAPSSIPGMFDQHGFLYSNGVAQDLGVNVLPGAINNAGDIVGGGMGAFVIRDGQLRLLGGRQAFALNNVGGIVGDAVFSGSGRAVIFEDDGPVDLNTLIVPDSGLRLLQAFGINDSGQIVGSAITSAGDQHAFLLTPIPEPAALSIFLLSGTLLLLRQRV